MKRVKKIALALVCVLVVGILAGCGNKFDAKAYMEAMLDASYKNDSSKFVEMNIGTADEAAALYEEGIDAEMDAFSDILSSMGAADELEGEFRQIVMEMLSKVKYTVDSAEQQDKETWVVTITYEQMIVWEPIIDDYITSITNLAAEWQEAMLAGGDVPSDDEAVEAAVELMRDSMKKAIANVEYASPATITVKIELKDNVWTPNQKDIEKLEMALFDMDALSSL